MARYIIKEKSGQREKQMTEVTTCFSDEKQNRINTCEQPLLTLMKKNQRMETVFYASKSMHAISKILRANVEKDMLYSLNCMQHLNTVAHSLFKTS